MRRAARFALLALLSGACMPYRHLPTAPPETYVRAERSLQRGDFARAADGFSAFLEGGGGRSYRPRAYYQLAQAEYALGHYEEALGSLLDLAQEFPEQSWPQADVLRGDIHYALGDRFDAVLYWEDAWGRVPASEQDLVEARVERAIGEMSEEEKRELAALASEPEVLAMLPEPVALPPLTDEMVALEEVDTEWSALDETAPVAPADVRDPASAGDEQYLAGNRVDAVLYWETAWAHGNADERALLRPRIQRAIDESNDEELELLDALLTEAGVRAMLPSAAEAPVVVARDESAPFPPGVRVAALLRLTGAARASGAEALRGLRLAFSEVPEALVVRDSGGETERATRLLAGLAADPQILGVIGVLGSSERPAAADTAERLGLPIVLIAPEIPRGGGYDPVPPGVVGRFQDTYGSVPTRLETEAFSAGTRLREAITAGATTRSALGEELRAERARSPAAYATLE